MVKGEINKKTWGTLKTWGQAKETEMMSEGEAKPGERMLGEQSSREHRVDNVKFYRKAK